MNPVAILAILSSASARPSLEKINYLHNISLTYDGQGITNLDSLNQMDGVDEGMANSLKKAILDVLPSYLAETQHSNGTFNDVQHETTGGQPSGMHSPHMGASSIQQLPAAHTGEASPVSQSQDDDQFWNRNDLVHFFVNIDTIRTTSAPSTMAAVPTGVPTSP